MSLAEIWNRLFKKKPSSVAPAPSAPVREPVVMHPPILENGSGPLVALSWELPCSDGQVSQGAKPENRSWSQALYSNLDPHWDVISKSPDMPSLVPAVYEQMVLSREQSLTLFCELMSCVAKYECSWNPKRTAPDTNGREGAEYRATGIFQMNAAQDQINYRTGTRYTASELLNPLINIEVGVKILRTVYDVRGKITFKAAEKSPILRYFFATLVTDGEVGKKVFRDYFVRREAILKAWATKRTGPAVSTEPPWKTEAKKYDRMKETDSRLGAFLIPKWALFNMNLGTISKNWAAWCGLAGATILVASNLNHPKDGALAKNWDKFDAITINYKVDGAPEGAFARLNHYGDCNRADGNHLTNFEGDCSAEDLKKPGATFAGRGGNQNDTWKVSVYRVKEICRVFWPKDAEMKPRKVTVSKNCTSGSASGESTR